MRFKMKRNYPWLMERWLKTMRIVKEIKKEVKVVVKMPKKKRTMTIIDNQALHHSVIMQLITNPSLISS